MDARSHGLDILRAAIPLVLFSSLPITRASEVLPIEQTTQSTPATLPQATYPEESLVAYDSRSGHPQGSLREWDDGHSLLVSTDSNSNSLTATGQSETE